MKNFIVLLALLFSFPLLSKAQQDSEYVPHYHKFFSDSSYSVITMERDTVEGYEVLKQTDKTQSYHIVTLWVGGESRPMLIAETNIQTLLSSAEGSQGSITLSGRISEGGSFNKTIWSKTISANETKYLYDYLEATYIGCCASVNTKELLRYSDGARLLLQTSDLSSVSIPNNRSKRYIGYLSSSAAMGYDEINDPFLCGVLTYMDPESLKSQRVVIVFKDSAATDSLGFDIFEKMKLSPTDPKDKQNYHGGPDLDLWSGEGKSDAIGYSGFTIDLHMFGNKIILRLPVKNDKIDISKVKSKWFNVALR